MSDAPCLEASIAAYITGITERFTGILGVWLIGSRANGASRGDSDWDFLVFADEDVLVEMASDESIRRNGVDLLVVFDGNSFRCPWPRLDKPGFKTGHLYPVVKDCDGLEILSEGYEWTRTAANEAEYRGRGLYRKKYRAFCVFDRSAKDLPPHSSET